MTSIQKARSLPMKAKLKKITIKRKSISNEKKIRQREYFNHCYRNDLEYREKALKNSKMWASIPENKIKRNIRQRLRRYKVKLNTQLVHIWLQRGLITM